MNSSWVLETLCSNLGASNSWNPHGLSRPVMGLLYYYLVPDTKLNTVPEESQGQISLIRSWSRPIHLPPCPLQIHPHARLLGLRSESFLKGFLTSISYASFVSLMIVTFRGFHDAFIQPCPWTVVGNLCKLFHYLRFVLFHDAVNTSENSLKLW